MIFVQICRKSSISSRKSSILLLYIDNERFEASLKSQVIKVATTGDWSTIVLEGTKVLAVLTARTQGAVLC